MTRARRRAVGLLMLLAAPGLAACGSPGEKYCDALTGEQETLTRLAGSAGEPGVVADTLASLERLREAAPEELRDEWDTLVFAYRGFADALEEAGFPEDGFTPGARPPGVGIDDYRAVAAAAGKLGSARVVAAADGIEQQAADVCKVSLTF